MNTQEYISPFRENSFSQRINNVINFGVQNFKKIIVFHLIILIPFCLISSLLDEEDKLGNLFSQITTAISSILALSFMLLYIKNKGLNNFKTEELFKNFGTIFAKGFLLGLITTAVLFIPILFAFLFIISIESQTTLAYSALLIAGVIIIYLAVIAQIFTTHYLLINDFDIISSIKETFRMIKGKWWNTTFFLLVFNIPRIIIVVVLFAIIGENNDIFATTIASYLVLLVSFFLSDVPLVYQYGYLITQRVNKDKAANVEDNITDITHNETKEPEEEASQPDNTTIEESKDETDEREQPTKEEREEEVVPETQNGKFKIEGSGSYSIELYSINNEEQISEALSALLGFSKEESQEKIENLPSIIADNLTITEALELSSLIQKYGGSTNIK